MLKYLNETAKHMLLLDIQQQHAPVNLIIIPNPMSKHLRRQPVVLVIALFIALLLTSCVREPNQPATLVPTLAPQAAPTADDDTIRQLTIYYTNDEHGWMAGIEAGRGAAEMMGLWHQDEQFDTDRHIILSGGDMWTGPAISTWFSGQSMTEVMNQMGYTAAAVGNHEFDFGLESLLARSQQQTFPLLSANIRYLADGSLPTDLGIQPYWVTMVNGIKIGIIGLTTTSTPFTTHPANVSQLEFIDYETALRESVASAKKEGAELILVPAHVCQDELTKLAQQIADLRVHWMGGGHCNERFAQQINGIMIVGSGAHLASYAKTTILFDTANDTVLSVEHSVHTNENGPADPAVAAIVNRWQTEVDEELNKVIGYLAQAVPRRSQTMEDLITESWLISNPAADVAITNLGGIRASLPSGELTLADITNVMPFNNVIIELRVTGQQLLSVLAKAQGRAAIGGVQQEGTQWRLNRSNQVIAPDQTYGLLVNDFMYAGGDNYALLAEFDPEAYDTAVDWRQPVIDWIEAQDSSRTNPIDIALGQIGLSEN